MTVLARQMERQDGGISQRFSEACTYEVQRFTQVFFSGPNGVMDGAE